MATIKTNKNDDIFIRMDFLIKKLLPTMGAILSRGEERKMHRNIKKFNKLRNELNRRSAKTKPALTSETT